jgi:hypothetical protein
MDADLVRLIEWGAVALVVLIALFAYKKLLRLIGIVIVPEDSVGIVTKKFVLLGSNKTLPDGRIIALKGEAGVQADTLAPGLHWWLWPWQYATTLQRFVVLPEGSIGIAEAEVLKRKGEAINPGNYATIEVARARAGTADRWWTCCWRSSSRAS